MLIALLAISLISTIPTLAFGPTNARLQGFGSAGVAVVPKDGQTAMAVNPAAPALLKQRQISISLAHRERQVEGYEWNDFDLDADFSSWDGDLEGYLPFGPVTVFGAIGGGSETKDWQRVETIRGEYSQYGDRKEESTLIRVGAAGVILERIAVGAQLLMLSRSKEDDEVRGLDYDISNNFTSEEFGVLMVTSAHVNLGLTWRAGDDNGRRFNRYHGMGLPETLRVGAAYQKEDGSWLVGLEYVSLETVSLVNPEIGFLPFEDEHLFGEQRIHLYGEYRFKAVSARAGLCLGDTDETLAEYTSYDDEFDYADLDHERLTISAGLSGRFSEHLGWDLFYQHFTGDGYGEIDMPDYFMPLYDYDEDGFSFGFGLTVRF
jgi:hypothetical protein